MIRLIVALLLLGLPVIDSIAVDYLLVDIAVVFIRIYELQAVYIRCKRKRRGAR